MERTARIAALDGLRAIFAFGIIIYHTNDLFDSAFYGIFSGVYQYGGYFGNDMFFIISGLLISLRYKQPLIDGTQRFPAFVKRRIWRVYPVYFLSNLAMIFFGGILFSIPRTCATFLMVSTGWFYSGDMPYNFPAWFLCVLLLCYILYYLVGTLSSRLPAVYPFLCVGFVLLGAILEVADLDIPFLYRVCGEGYLNFFLGALLGEFFRIQSEQTLEQPKKKRYQQALCYSILIASIALAAICGFSVLPGDPRWWITLICASLVATAMFGGVLSRLLSVSFLQALGRRSLSLTLWHIPLARVLVRFLPLQQIGTNLGFVLYLLLSVGAAFLSYEFLEREAAPSPILPK